jgi:hypothetical protein
MEERKRWDIIGSYGKILEDRKTSVGLETDLPFSKALIRIVILEDLFYQTDLKLQDHLKVAFTDLESFLPNEEFEILNGFNKTLLNTGLSHFSG